MTLAQIPTPSIRVDAVARIHSSLLVLVMMRNAPRFIFPKFITLNIPRRCGIHGVGSTTGDAGFLAGEAAGFETVFSIADGVVKGATADTGRA